MPTKAKKASPATCKFCARFKPEKCKRHGGAAHSTSNGQNRNGGSATLSTKPKLATKTGTGLPSFESALVFLDTQIEGAEERLTKLKAARDGMAMLVEASR